MEKTAFDEYKKDVENSPAYKEFEKVDNILRMCNDEIIRAAQENINALTQLKFHTITSEIRYDYKNKSYIGEIGIQHPYLDQLTFWPKIICRIEQQELVVEGHDGAVGNEIYRSKAHDINRQEFKNKIKIYYEQGLISRTKKEKK